MHPRRVAALAALCGTMVLGGSVPACFLGFVSSRLNGTDATIDARRAASVSAAAIEAAPANTRAQESPPLEDFRSAAPPVPEPPAAPAAPGPETPAAQTAVISTPAPVQSGARETVSPGESSADCDLNQSCIDQYLWSIYERAPKLDTTKVREKTKVTIIKKGKARTILKTVIWLLDNDFTWKDPKAAERAGMSLKDYVIGGMDRRFKLRLYHALRAMDEAGLAPGITSGFRDDYRQSLASGNHVAAAGNSYHGGSRRGGYGHGLAADIVSVKGETREERWTSSEELWKWIDLQGGRFGIGRPYLDRDPPHVGPTDGPEYVQKRLRGRTRFAGLANRHHR